MDFCLAVSHIVGMWLVLGWIFVGLGAIGAALPLMPTVPFLLVALFCFERGSPRLHKWLMEHPIFGSVLVDWQKHRRISWKAKFIATIGLCVSSGFTFYSSKPIEIKLMVGGICALAILFILTRKSSRR